jgi:hypothetical protein
MAQTKAKSKKELLAEQITAVVGAGREVAVQTVDFADANRPKTCLEVDFPIIPINQIANIEGNAGKPIYQMSKWWARRRSSVFRSMLLAAAMKAPDDESKAAKAVWDVYYANHQKRGSLRHLKVFDPFMGGGTTLVEGSRLGMQMSGCDLNPVAWLVVRNELASVKANEVNCVLKSIEADVKPQIAPYYACDGPHGEKGGWFRLAQTRKCRHRPVQLGLNDETPPPTVDSELVWEKLPPDFDIFTVAREERRNYRYEGPELIYSFWIKHIACRRQGCGHYTPVMSSPVIAVKTLSVDAWRRFGCSCCNKEFDIERYETRMAPDVPLYFSPEEKPFSVMENEGIFKCPHCGAEHQDEQAFAKGDSLQLGKAEGKKVDLTLLVHPDWLAGCPKFDREGREYGGSTDDPLEATHRWNEARAATLRLLEVRGTLPEQVTCPETHVTFYTDRRGGTSKKMGHFTCGAPSCGTQQSMLESIEATGKSAPWAQVCIQAYSPKRDRLGLPYGGRFFFAPRSVADVNWAQQEWIERRFNDLERNWPKSLIPVGHMTHERNPLPRHGITRWTDFFNSRQLLVHALLLRAILRAPNCTQEVREFVLGGFQQYLRNNNLFCIWDISRDGLAPHLSNNNFNPKNTAIENSVFAVLGRGNWTSCTEGLIEGVAWARNPFEIVSGKLIAGFPELHYEKNAKVSCGDPVLPPESVTCQSATDLSQSMDASFDLVITDPPFGGLLHYAELSDFFHVWLRLALKDVYPNEFAEEYSPKALEAVSNEARHPDDPDGFYQRVLTESWNKAKRLLKPGGILAFTFHHSEDDPWVRVLESLFDAGFYLEATYPIRSDETKGEGEFGSKQIEYDIIHVCRKRVATPEAISWAKLRRLIVDDVRRIASLLSQHQKEGLPAADLQVIKKGKALEYFSRHYGKVYIEQGREFTLRDALLGIDQLLYDDAGRTSGGPDAPPSNAEPYTRQFFRIFYETTQVPRDQMQKFLRGTGVAPSDFEERGWCSEKNKVFVLTPPVELARTWKGLSRKGMARDFDQTMFLVGACVEGSNIRVTDTLDSPNFTPHPATAELVDWLGKHGGSQEIKFAAQRARTIYRDWLGRNKAKEQDQMKLFDLET